MKCFAFNSLHHLHPLPKHHHCQDNDDDDDNYYNNDDDDDDQVLISCGPMDGCHGGDAGVANKWMADHGITVSFIIIGIIVIMMMTIVMNKRA